jgi:hypothetical protein
MVPRVACAALAAVCTIVVTVRASDQPQSQLAEIPPLLTRHHVLQASLQRIAAGSALWREAVEAVRQTGRHALILTPDQVVVADRVDDRPTTAFDGDLVAEVAPVLRHDSRIDQVLVVVNLALLEAIYRNNLTLPIEAERDLDRLLVHEVYGHALPYLIAGDLSGRCPDPTRHQRAVDACSIRRENAVRAELGLGRRTDYGLAGLALARRGFR